MKMPWELSLFYGDWLYFPSPYLSGQASGSIQVLRHRIPDSLHHREANSPQLQVRMFTKELRLTQESMLGKKC